MFMVGCDEDPANILACDITCPAGQIVTIDCTCFEDANVGDVTIDKSGLITLDETWTKDNIYTLKGKVVVCLLYTSPSPRDRQKSRMPSSA